MFRSAKSRLLGASLGVGLAVSMFLGGGVANAAPATSANPYGPSIAPATPAAPSDPSVQPPGMKYVCTGPTAGTSGTVPCPPASVYSTWAHRTYTGTTTLAEAREFGVTPDAYTCTLYVANVYFAGGDINGNTVLGCFGSVGTFGTNQQFLRTSYSGPRGYSKDYAGTTYNRGSGTQAVDWYTVCRSGAGSYQYAGSAYPIVNQRTQSPTVVSNDYSPQTNCGPNNGGTKSKYYFIP